MNGSTTPEEEEKLAPPTQVKEKTSSTEKEEGAESSTTQREGREESTTHEGKATPPCIWTFGGFVAHVWVNTSFCRCDETLLPPMCLSVCLFTSKIKCNYTYIYNCNYCANFVCSVTRSTTAEFQHNDMMMRTSVQNDLRLEMALESMWICLCS